MRLASCEVQSGNNFRFLGDTFHGRSVVVTPQSLIRIRAGPVKRHYHAHLSQPVYELRQCPSNLARGFSSSRWICPKVL